MPRKERNQSSVMNRSRTQTRKGVKTKNTKMDNFRNGNRYYGTGSKITKMN